MEALSGKQPLTDRALATSRSTCSGDMMRPCDDASDGCQQKQLYTDEHAVVLGCRCASRQGAGRSQCCSQIVLDHRRLPCADAIIIKEAVSES